MRAILDITGRDANRSIRATRTSQLYVSAGYEAKGGAMKAGSGVYLLDRIEAALDKAGGDPVKASAICGIAEREIAKIQRLKAAAAADTESIRARETAVAKANESRRNFVTDAHVAQLIDAAKVHGTYVAAGRALGWTEKRVWLVHRRGIAKGTIKHKEGRR